MWKASIQYIADAHNHTYMFMDGMLKLCKQKYKIKTSVGYITRNVKLEPYEYKDGTDMTVLIGC